MPTTTADPCRPPRRPRAFTTIELMVAIAIIIVLMGIVVFGYRRVATGSQENQTRTILERLRSMQGTITSNKTAGQRFFQVQIPTVYGYQLDGTTVQVWDAVPAGSDDALAKTAQVLTALTQSPEARAILDELPANRKRLMHFTRATNAIAPAANGNATISATMPLDAWNNPVIFVYDNWQESLGTVGTKLHTLAGGGDTGGLTYLWSTAAKGYWKPVTAQNVQQPTGYASNNTAQPAGYTSNLGTALRSPDRQPFWVSAGPDGNFQTHDDNVYSFEN